MVAARSGNFAGNAGPRQGQDEAMEAPAPLTERDLREIAHELRAPLGGISAMIELISRTALSAEQQRFVGALRASAEHLHAVCSRALGPVAGAAAIEPAQLGALLESIALSTAARAATKGCGFRLDVAAALARWRIEAGSQCRQVLENLIDNAVRLTHSGEVAVAVEARGGDRLVFRVNDSGPGLSAEDATRLIRQGGGIEGRPGGAGIGLTIAGRLVAENGGELSGGPGPQGHGACFTFDWPASDAITDRGKGGRCLVVDDHPASRQVTIAILGALGLPCEAVEGVDAAIARQAEEGHMLVLTDLCMPQGGGERLIRHFSSLPADRRPKVVVISADAVPGDSPLGGLIAAAVAKPIGVRALADALALCGVLSSDESRAA